MVWNKAKAFFIGIAKIIFNWISKCCKFIFRLTQRCVFKIKKSKVEETPLDKSQSEIKEEEKDENVVNELNDEEK